MSDSILDRIRSNRKRTIVPTRQDPLMPSTAEDQLIPEDDSLTTVADSKPDSYKSTNQNEATLEQLKAELAKYPATRRHSAIVLDTEIDSKLTQFCKEKGITVEVFLEAVWLTAMAEETLMEKILVEAKHRYNSRKQAGKLRRLITMLSQRNGE